MKEMIKKYRGSLICSVLVMLIGVLVGCRKRKGGWFDAENCGRYAEFSVC